MENQQNNLLEREQLYEQVWSKPMIKLAADYGLSDNGVRKNLRRDEPFAQAVVPDHKTVDRDTLRSIIRQSGLLVDQFLELVRK